MVGLRTGRLGVEKAGRGERCERGNGSVLVWALGVVICWESWEDEGLILLWKDVKATYVALFATSFATVRSSYNTGAAALPT